MGGTAVTFFFVLSGFLITYLLLAEKQQTGTISLKDFYLKRIFRIWPLYFLIVTVGIFFIPFIHELTIPGFEEYKISWVNTALFLSILPNIVFATEGFTPYLVQTWSIGVEEQFYMIWPLIFMCMRKPIKGMIATIFIYVVAFILIRIGLTGAFAELAATEEFWSKMLSIIRYTRIDCMAIGGIGAYLLFERKPSFLRAIYHPAVLTAALSITVVLMGAGIKFPAFGHQVYAVLFLVIILNVAVNPGKRILLMLENNWMNYLGKISYGLYMYHFPMIGIAIALLRSRILSQQMDWVSNCSLYVLTLLLTITVSALSYHLFESKVMSLRPAFGWLNTRKRRHEPLIEANA
jgi:peptidoglycan/LPS O-acetylase OafA/YrhL